MLNATQRLVSDGMELQGLIEREEDPYWAQEDIGRCPVVPPTICVAEYRKSS